MTYLLSCSFRLWKIAWGHGRSYMPLIRFMREGFAISFGEARPARARRATRALPTADDASLSRREGACPPPLRADGIVPGSTRSRIIRAKVIERLSSGRLEIGGGWSIWVPPPVSDGGHSDGDNSDGGS